MIVTLLSRSGRSSANRCATLPPRSWPTRWNRSWPSAVISAAMSPAMVRNEWLVKSALSGGFDDAP